MQLYLGVDRSMNTEASTAGDIALASVDGIASFTARLVHRDLLVATISPLACLLTLASSVFLLLLPLLFGRLLVICYFFIRNLCAVHTASKKRIVLVLLMLGILLATGLC